MECENREEHNYRPLFMMVPKVVLFAAVMGVGARTRHCRHRHLKDGSGSHDGCEHPPTAGVVTERIATVAEVTGPRSPRSIRCGFSRGDSRAARSTRTSSGVAGACYKRMLNDVVDVATLTMLKVGQLRKWAT